MILTSRNNYINKTKVLYRTSKINQNFVTLGAYIYTENLEFWLENEIVQTIPVEKFQKL